MSKEDSANVHNDPSAENGNTYSSMYDLLAPHYRHISEERSKWIDAINSYICENLNPTDSLLDVGAADGIRARNIADKVGIQNIDLVEPSVEMSHLASKTLQSRVFTLPAEILLELPSRGYNAILCLWNVLGHIPTHERRITSIRNMLELLDREGTIFIDVNNRYNIRAYAEKALHNIEVDKNFPEGMTNINGDVFYRFECDHMQIPATGHVFSEKELSHIVTEAGAQIKDIAYFDYETGERVRSQFEGQIMMTLGKPNNVS